jgi:phospholipid-binding lipoprotein MlaA
MRIPACLCMLFCLCVFGGSLSPVCAAGTMHEALADKDDSLYDPFEKNGGKDEQQQLVADPLEKFNRGMFVFNDKLYYWVLKPTAQGYSYVMPEPARRCVKRFFINLATPIRLVNCLLQGRFKGAGSELTRFTVNSTAGIGGLFDPAHYCWELKRFDEDTGRTFGSWGVGHGIYIVWPFFGPSSARDTVGMVGDAFLDPTSYVNLNLWERAGIEAYQKVNNVSLKIDEYDEFKKSAVDPYVSLKTAYIQNRDHGLRK